jgi:hypothetical protein
MVIEGKELWRPRQAFADASNIRQYQNWLKAEYGIDTNHYDELGNGQSIIRLTFGHQSGHSLMCNLILLTVVSLNFHKIKNSL